ncbi:MAG TPA: tetratricopeptide repeat protein, partial [Kofleriaceae bacterium]|nr:tetratricopeptide repeat protein [Kofleriaceae bacterium]
KGKEHFARGKKLFDKKDYKGAVKEFKASFRLTRNPLLLYNIGYTFDQLGDKSLALFYYQKYLEQAPASDGNRQAAEGRVQVLEIEIEEAKIAGGGEPAPARAPQAEPEKDSPVSSLAPTGPAVSKFQHMVIDEAPPGRPIDVSAVIPSSKKWTVTLHYRAAGEESFTAAEMKPRHGELVARIPAAKTVGASVQYYIEVKDARSKVVDRSGTKTSPNLVLLDRGARARYYADMGEERAEPIAGDDGELPGGGGAFGGGAEARGDGWTDAGSSRFNKLKWGATGAAAGFLALSTTFYLLSAKAGSDLEAEAAASSDPAQCGGTVPPCRTFSDKQQSLEGKGERFERFANISLGVGAAAAIGAGVLWYLEVRDARKRRRAREEAPSSDEPKLSATPVIGEDFVGGAAAVRF